MPRSPRTFTLTLEGVDRDFTVPAGAKAGEEHDFSFVDSNGSTRQIRVAIPADTKKSSLKRLSSVLTSPKVFGRKHSVKRSSSSSSKGSPILTGGETDPGQSSGTASPESAADEDETSRRPTRPDNTAGQPAQTTPAWLHQAEKQQDATRKKEQDGEDSSLASCSTNGYGPWAAHTTPQLDSDSPRATPGWLQKASVHLDTLSKRDLGRAFDSTSESDVTTAPAGKEILEEDVAPEEAGFTWTGAWQAVADAHWWALSTLFSTDGMSICTDRKSYAAHAPASASTPGR